jgi:hypothetical protein
MIITAKCFYHFVKFLFVFLKQAEKLPMVGPALSRSAAQPLDQCVGVNDHFITVTVRSSIRPP